MNPGQTTASTGPRTESGKATSSKNAIKNGLFAARDYILAHETDEYAETLTKLLRFLKPRNALEEIFAAEIVTASWRLRRCGLLESALATRDLTPEDLASEQKPIDRARSQAHSIMRRSTAELRKLQTEGAIRAELAERGFDIEDFPGLTDSRQLLATIKAWDKHLVSTKTEEPPASADPLADLMARADQALGMKTPFGSSFCNPTLSTAAIRPRNAA